MSKIKDWAASEYNITLTGKQANDILTALLNGQKEESAYWDFSAALAEAGYWKIEKEGK